MSTLMVVITFFAVALCAVVWLSQLALLAPLLFGRAKSARSEPSRRLSVIVAIDHNTATPVDNVHRALRAGQDEIEVIAVVDGAAENALGKLVMEFGLEAVHPVYQKTVDTRDVRSILRSPQDRRLVVVEKLAGGIGDALNSGLNICSGERVVSQRDGVEFLEAGLRMLDTNAGAEGVATVLGPLLPAGEPMVRSARRSRNWMLNHRVWNWAGGSLIAPDGVLLFHRDALLTAGGFVTPADPDGSQVLVRLGLSGVRTRTAGFSWAVDEPVGTQSVVRAPEVTVSWPAIRLIDTGPAWRRLGAVHRHLVRLTGPVFAAGLVAATLAVLLGAGAGPLLVLGASLCLRATVLILANTAADRTAAQPRSTSRRLVDVFSSLLDAPRLAAVTRQGLS